MTLFYIKFLNIQEIDVQRGPGVGGNSGWVPENGSIQIHLFWSHHYHGLVLAGMLMVLLEFTYFDVRILKFCFWLFKYYQDAYVLHVIKINRNREAEVSALRKSPLTQFFLSGREWFPCGSFSSLVSMSQSQRHRKIPMILTPCKPGIKADVKVGPFPSSDFWNSGNDDGAPSIVIPHVL